jgi:hypothetical protein
MLKAEIIRPGGFEKPQTEQGVGDPVFPLEGRKKPIHRSVIENEHPDDPAQGHDLQIPFFSEAAQKIILISPGVQFQLLLEPFAYNGRFSQKGKAENFQKGVLFSVLNILRGICP